MKNKKGVFANGNTCYGKSNKSTTNQPRSGSAKRNTKPVNVKDQPTEAVVEDANADLNSGFGDYLRSPEAVEMMKLFVFANSIMLIVTMAWPNIKEQYYIIRQWLSIFQDS